MCYTKNKLENKTNILTNKTKIKTKKEKQMADAEFIYYNGEENFVSPAEMSSETAARIRARNRRIGHEVLGL